MGLNHEKLSIRNGDPGKARKKNGKVMTERKLFGMEGLEKIWIRSQKNARRAGIDKKEAQRSWPNRARTECVEDSAEHRLDAEGGVSGDKKGRKHNPKNPKNQSKNRTPEVIKPHSSEGRPLERGKSGVRGGRRRKRIYRGRSQAGKGKSLVEKNLPQRKWGPKKKKKGKEHRKAQPVLSQASHTRHFRKRRKERLWAKADENRDAMSYWLGTKGCEDREKSTKKAELGTQKPGHTFEAPNERSE